MKLYQFGLINKTLYFHLHSSNCEFFFEICCLILHYGFQKICPGLSMLYITVCLDYYEQALKELLDDGVQYVEVRYRFWDIS